AKPRLTESQRLSQVLLPVRKVAKGVEEEPETIQTPAGLPRRRRHLQRLLRDLDRFGQIALVVQLGGLRVERGPITGVGLLRSERTGEHQRQRQKKRVQRRGYHRSP